MDRNIAVMTEAQSEAVSLSARRAWIEMNGLKSSIPVVGCRSPQGERG